MSRQDDIETSCYQVLDRFLEALNAYDAQGMDAAMHFPHARIANSTMVTYAHAGSNPMDLFEKLTQQDGWHHSAWNDRRLVQYSDTKAHVAVEYTRYRVDNSVMGVSIPHCIS